ncbi:hypothetical protein GUITHDRAFT_147124 [Guillardia theta CCMP2712]|uniref:Uncharacterized protein n=1 Tax=Guillardia theta (strain CCMP2712) TaxID=905079 RepID=L1IEA7_GUITC|nr:hypothetical protein GUITHDRAFT_147124 [Guillardia theta CCMP2712]EKX34606.1 hypothetical protein GUITHDRAFT_147124 [Guillardia theta CCMP2712]|eukprot:XP_005821586.1 hypothetical protein GUITHDRAFT_147124 [Guillardia theta CCMP2712]
MQQATYVQSPSQPAYVQGSMDAPGGKLVEPRLRFEREIGRRRLLEILRAVAHDGRVFEHGQQGKAWTDLVESLNQQEIFQIHGKGALKIGTAKEKFNEGLKAWKEESRRRMEAGEPAPAETEMDGSNILVCSICLDPLFSLWRRCVALEAYHQSHVFQTPLTPCGSKRPVVDDALSFPPSIFDREEARAMAERKLVAEEKRAVGLELRGEAAEETKAKADLLQARATMIERLMEARQQGFAVPDDFMQRLLQQ